MNDSFASASKQSLHNRSRSFGNNIIRGMPTINEEKSLHVSPKEYSSSPPPPIKSKHVRNESLMSKL